MESVLRKILVPVAIAGTITLSSFNVVADNEPPQRGGGQPPSFDQFDTNGDGVLTKDELKGPLLDDFDRFDVDGSNSLSEDELPEPPQQQSH